MRIQHEVRTPRDYSKRGDALPIPNLVRVQQDAYVRFLQKDIPVDKRKNEGLESLLREVFPIESYDGNLKLDYISYDLSEPRSGMTRQPWSGRSPSCTSTRKSTPGERWSWLTMTRSAPLMMNSPPPIMIGTSPR